MVLKKKIFDLKKRKIVFYFDVHAVIKIEKENYYII
jgi:hypothetical protein